MKKKKEEKNENCLDSLWAILIISLLFWEPPKEKKAINIYMGDDK